MNELIGLRKNIYYTKDSDGQMVKHHELIFIVREPSYTLNNEHEISRQSTVKDLRFSISDNKAPAFLEHLQQLLQAQE